MSKESIERRARELLAECARKIGQPEYAYHVGCGGDLDLEDQALIETLMVALTPQWQPIETAPKDGTLILLGRLGDEANDRLPISTPGRWFEGYEDSVDDMGHDDGFMDCEFQEFSCPRSFGAESYRHAGYQPTHWQPLPAAPEVA